MKAITLELNYLGSALEQSSKQASPALSKACDELIKGSCKGSEFTGWLNYPEKRGGAELKKVRTMMDKLDVDYDCVVVIGIGGSYLGTRAVYGALSTEFAASHSPKGKKPIIFLGHHLASEAIRDVLEFLKDKKPIVNVISKSGTTTEPAILFRIMREYLTRSFGAAEANKRIIATTDPAKGALRSMAKEYGWTCFEVPADIGGRFSVLTAVGLVPLALAGFDVDALMRGANFEFENFAKQKQQSTAAVYAEARQACSKAGKVTELLAYADPKLFYLTEWWKQLFGESEGKDGKGIFPAALVYTTDLHSLGQFVQDGTRNLFETFLIVDQTEEDLKVPRLGNDIDELLYLEGKRIEDVNIAAMRATKVAHFDGGVPCMELHVPEINEAGIGQLFAFFEIACALSAGMSGVNPFDQPGVEAYKKNLFAMLGKPGFENLAKELAKRDAK